MVSDFRKKKLMHIFNAFFDTNRSGSVDKKDFELSAEKIALLRGWTKGHPHYLKAQENLMKIWNGLQKKADVNNDGEVSADEWVALWDEFARDPSAPQDWQNLYCRFVFQLEDSKNDGVIDEDEFSSVYVSFGLDEEESREAFKKISRGKPTVSWPEFQTLWKEYFTTEDQEAAGNFIFGCYICSLSKHSHSHAHAHSHSH